MALIENRFPTTPVRHLAFDEPRPAAAPVAVIDLRDFVAVIKRRRAWIVWPAAVCVIVASLYSLALPARYTASTQILLDPHGLHVLQNDLSARSAASGDTSLAEAESQLQVVASAGVLTAVVDREKLQTDPEFGEAPPSVLESIAGLLVHSAPEDRTLKAVRILQSRVTARRPDKTFVIDVSVWSEDRAKAARIANAIAAIYLDQEGTTKTDAAKRTTVALGSRLAELRERVSQSAHRVEDYKAQHKIIGASGQLVSEQQLSELNNQLGLAHTRTAEQRARYEDIQRLQRNHVEPDAIAEAIQSPAITALRSQYAEAKQAEANAERDSRSAPSDRHRRRRPGRAKPAHDRRGSGAHRPHGAERIRPRKSQRGIASAKSQHAEGRCNEHQSGAGANARARTRGRIGSRRLCRVPQPRQGSRRAGRRRQHQFPHYHARRSAPRQERAAAKTHHRRFAHARPDRRPWPRLAARAIRSVDLFGAPALVGIWIAGAGRAAAIRFRRRRPSTNRPRAKPRQSTVCATRCASGNAARAPAPSSSPRPTARMRVRSWRSISRSTPAQAANRCCLSTRTGSNRPK